MKNIKYKSIQIKGISRQLLMCLIPLFLFNCTDLKEDPIGVLAPEGFFKTEKDVQLAINGAYGKIAADDYWGRELSLAIGLSGDMMDIGNRGTVAARIQINDFNANAFNSLIGRFWPASYSIISTVNTAMEGAEVVENEEVKNALIAEARFLRAFTYFNLVRLFGDIPYIDKAVVDPEAVGEISKTSATVVYEKIIEDLNFAIDHLPMNHIQNVRSRPSKGTAHTMLADVYLTLSNWQEAYNHAKYVIDNANTLGYGLIDDYQTLYKATEQDGLAEHVFAIDFKGNEGSWPYNVDSHPAFTGTGGSDDMEGWDVEVPSMAVYDTWDDRDYRKSVAMFDSAYFDGVKKSYLDFNTPRPHIAKYRRFPGNAQSTGNTGDTNYAIYRYAEVLLTAAEALNELNGVSQEAINYVNQVRERARNWAGTATDFPEDLSSGLSQDEFRTAVLEERRLELSFEFKRWWDIKRRNMGEEVFKGPNSLEPRENFTDNHYLLPLPQGELDRNPNLLPQNPGY
ncbi:RagB/SusD family nutrient uptake outer membrane protein [Membranihabitans marinus]|uniref:RagB/SusD family nutrient uptake outer membrane protein n=1 Tax=Membranihabitans marinus TaxID=1227546 RepID=UPI001F477525|nr:RagB/SusD family nutrient uptake outer membrane protein [Membranihabitans marinus]